MSLLYDDLDVTPELTSTCAMKVESLIVGKAKVT